MSGIWISIRMRSYAFAFVFSIASMPLTAKSGRMPKTLLRLTTSRFCALSSTARIRASGYCSSVPSRASSRAGPSREGADSLPYDRRGHEGLVDGLGEAGALDLVDRKVLRPRGDEYPSGRW